MMGTVPAAVQPFLNAPDSRPRWGEAHCSLARTYWHLDQYPLALEHARLAQDARVRKAASAVLELRAQLTPSGPPRLCAGRN